MLHRLQYEQNRAFARGGGPRPSLCLSRGPSASRGEILTFPDTPTTQGLSLWCFNTVRVVRGGCAAAGLLGRVRAAADSTHAPSGRRPAPSLWSVVCAAACSAGSAVRAAAYAAADSTHAPSGRRTADRRRADEGRHGRRARAGTPRGLSVRYRAPLLALAGLGGASAPSFRLVAAGRGPRPPTATPPCSL